MTKYALFLALAALFAACKTRQTAGALKDAPPSAAPAGTFDWRDAVIYFAFADRFADGDGANPCQTPGASDPLVDYQGGDWQGIKAKIDDGYFNDLGVNALWLTVPVKNSTALGAGIGGDASRSFSSYHGYWPLDMQSLDSCFGTAADIEALVASAHAKGLKVLFDFAMVHAHQDAKVFKDHPDWFWPNKNGAKNCLCGQGCSWDDDGERCWFTDYLPHWNYTVAAARAYSVGAAIDLVKKTGVDGLRLDAIRHVDMSWVEELRKRLTAEVAPGSRFYLVGETYNFGDRDYIKRWVDPAKRLDGQFDFPLRLHILRTLLLAEHAPAEHRETMAQLATFMDGNDGFYGKDAIMSTWVGNHDVGRAIHVAQDKPLWTDPYTDGKWSGSTNVAWTDRPVAPKERSAFERLANAFAVILTNQGAPLLYYGDEIGMAGAGDPDNRRMMSFSGLDANQTWLRERITRLLATRAAHPALRRGVRKTLLVSDDVWIYEMRADDDVVVVAINRGDKAQTPAWTLPAGLKDALSGAAADGPLQLAPRQTVVLAAGAP